ncbi:MAG: discoidin domain-containing protein, partial [Bacillota bacterium]|nr:discoidin domain-containing protein [Bacillota bacterium]
MKRSLSLVLVIAMVLSLCITVPMNIAATNIAADETAPSSWTVSARDATGCGIGDASNVIDGTTANIFDYGATAGPYCFDINLGSATTISGIRWYPRQDSNTAGIPTSWDVYAKFSGDEGYTKLYSGSKTVDVSDSGAEAHPLTDATFAACTTRFGYNATVTAVRVVFTGTYDSTASVSVGEISILTALSATYRSGNEVYYTFSSASQIDELDSSGYTYTADGTHSAAAVNANDGNLSTIAETTLNGTGSESLIINLGAVTAFDGFRYYPPADGKGQPALYSIFLSNDGVSWYYVSQSRNFGSAKNASSTYDLYNDATDGTAALTAKFYYNLSAKYIRLRPEALGSTDTSTTAHFGEVKLLKPDDSKKLNDANTGYGPSMNYMSDEYNWNSSSFASMTASSSWNTWNVINLTVDSNPMNYWHSAVGSASNVLPDTNYWTLTYMFNTPQEIYGIRHTPRIDNIGAIAKTIEVWGTYDSAGTNWYKVADQVYNYTVGAAPAAQWGAGNQNVTYFNLCKNNNFYGIKYVITRVGTLSAATGYHTNVGELRFLKSGTSSNLVLTDEVNTDYNPWSATATSGTAANLPKLYDGIINTAAGDNTKHFETTTDATGTTTGVNPANNLSQSITFDLGKSYTFSGLRIYNRYNFSTQAMAKGYLWVSDDNTNWYKLDQVATGVTNYPTSDNRTVYFSIDDTRYNITARYVKLECTQVLSSYNWALEEVTLLNPNNVNSTLTVSGDTGSVSALFQAKVQNVIDLINAIGTVTADSGNAIKAARDAYNALAVSLQPSVTNYTTLTDAETAYSNFAATAVVNEIAALPDKANVTLDNNDAIKAARTDYNALSSDKQALVTNLSRLTDAELIITGLTYSVNTMDSVGLFSATFKVYNTSGVASISYE